MQEAGQRIAGLDGCRAGWFGVRADTALADIRWFVAATFAEAAGRLADCAIVGVDIPIGLPDSGSRSCDRQARKLLAPRRTSSVFPAPIRPVLGATSYREACERRLAVDGKRMSAQAFHILGKIGEVDRCVLADPGARFRVREVHPELSFARLNAGAAITAPKRSREGFAARYRLIAGRIDPACIDAALATYRRKDVSRDDVLDAFAVMLTARRIAAGRGQRMPPEPEYDSRGLDMAIWF
jgi:predicted RNase H-like nuclease